MPYVIVWVNSISILLACADSYVACKHNLKKYQNTKGGHTVAISAEVKGMVWKN